MRDSSTASRSVKAVRRTTRLSGRFVAGSREASLGRVACGSGQPSEQTGCPVSILCDSRVDAQRETLLFQARARLLLPRLAGVGSYSDNQRGEMLFGNRKIILFERENVPVDRLSNVRNGLLPGGALRDATWKTRALGNPKSVFARVNDRLSHTGSLPARNLRSIWGGSFHGLQSFTTPTRTVK